MLVRFELGVVGIVAWVAGGCASLERVAGGCAPGLASAARRSALISCVAFSSSVGIPT